MPRYRKVTDGSFCLLLAVAHPAGSVHAQIPYDSGELSLALKRLEVLGSVLYVAAHPDDENTAFLATMAKHRHFRTGNLSITRGDGGQNLLGSEQGEMLGLIRTQELLGARRIDGAEQFFTRAIDFGYSKTTEETLNFWGKEETLGDVVWVIRKFRPDVIVSRFTPATRGARKPHRLGGSRIRSVPRSGGFPQISGTAEVRSTLAGNPYCLEWLPFSPGGNRYLGSKRCH